MTTITQTITSLPTAPARNQPPATFIANADATMAALGTLVTQANTWAGQVNTVAGEVNTNAATATTKAAEATASAYAAGVAASAIAWVSGTTYAIGDCRFSPSNYQTYRRKTNGAGTADPSSDTTNWALLNNVLVSTVGGATASGSVTLTSASASAQSITPTAYGQAVTLPDATTLSASTGRFTIANAGSYDYWIKDSAGTFIGLLHAGNACTVSLSDNSTAAGVWSISGSNDVLGVEASATIATSSGVSSDTTNPNIKAIPLDATRTLLIAHYDVAAHAVVYNSSTSAFGTATLVRTGNLSQPDYLSAVKTATDQVMVITCPSASTAMETVILSISGSTITVNTPTATTLAGNINAYGISEIIAVGTSFLVAYSRDTTVVGARAITISGTTPTVGAENVQSGNGYYPIIYNVTGSVALIFSSVTASTMYARPVTVSGSTITTGTETSFAITSQTYVQFRQLASGRFAVVYINTKLYGAIVNVSGTVATVSTVQLTTVAPSYLFAEVIGSQVIVGQSAASAVKYINVLTDNAGTAVAGTQVTFNTAHTTTTTCSSLGIYNGKVLAAFSVTGYEYFATISISGNNAVLENLSPIRTIAAGVESVFYGANFGKSSALSTDNFYTPKGAISTMYSAGRIATPAGTRNSTVSAIHINGTFGASTAEKWFAMSNTSELRMTITKMRFVL